MPFILVVLRKRQSQAQFGICSVIGKMTTSVAPNTPNSLGVCFVATWQQDCSGWAVEPYEPGTAPASAEAYVDSLPTRTSSAALGSFLAHPSPMAAFDGL